MRTNAYNRESGILFKDGQRYTRRNVLGEPGAGADRNATNSALPWPSYPEKKKIQVQNGARRQTPDAVTWNFSPNPQDNLPSGFQDKCKSFHREWGRIFFPEVPGERSSGRDGGERGACFGRNSVEQGH
jgi:hypothetical protein